MRYAFRALFEDIILPAVVIALPAAVVISGLAILIAFALEAVSK